MLFQKAQIPLRIQRDVNKKLKNQLRYSELLSRGKIAHSETVGFERYTDGINKGKIEWSKVKGIE